MSFGIFYDLNNPKDARAFIAEMVEKEIPKAECVETNNGRIIRFTRMTDSDALIAARILFDLVVESAHGRERH